MPGVRSGFVVCASSAFLSDSTRVARCGPGRVARAQLLEQRQRAVVVVRLLGEQREPIERFARHVRLGSRREQLFELPRGEVEVAFLLIGVGQVEHRGAVVGVGDRDPMQALDRLRAIAALERHLRGLEVLAVLRERIDPARDVARALEALDRAVELPARANASPARKSSPAERNISPARSSSPIAS
jgi:hypothetical protein